LFLDFHNLELHGRLNIGYNVLGLGEGGDLQHKTSSEAPKFKFTKNCPTKHAPPLLPNPCYLLAFLSSVSACAVEYFLLLEGKGKFLIQFFVGLAKQALTTALVLRWHCGAAVCASFLGWIILCST